MKPGGDLMVTLDGRIETAPAAERGGDQERLVVERFLHASPGEICLEQPARTDLVQAHWELVRVGSQTVTASASHREPWIVLDPDGQSLHGWSGCNHVQGDYRVASDGRLRFSRVTLTRMACPRSADERAFVRALERTLRYRIHEGKLELLGAYGALLARFDERHLD